MMLTEYIIHAEIDERFNCQTDKDCQERWADSVCIEMELFGNDVRKCAPHREAIKPACRGSSFGLCPAYQSPSKGQLNVECVFRKVSSLNLLLSSSENGSLSLCEPGNVDSQCFLKLELEIQNVSKTYIGQFQCVDVNTCEQTSLFPQTCPGRDSESNCLTGSVQEQCNRRGTCTPSAFDQLASNTKQCLCQTGFGGNRCEKILGPECDVSCGENGDCVDGECECQEHWDSDAQCETCSSDEACLHGTCGTDGTCVCEEGYIGKQCDTTEHQCVGLTCGLGNCQEGICMCPVCRGDTCEKCTDKFCLECSKSDSLIVIQSSIMAFIMVLYFLDTLSRS